MSQLLQGAENLIFEDRIGRLLVIELKRGDLERGAISQLIDYYGMLKSRFPEKAVELMIIANRINSERRQACEKFDIEPLEIAEKKFRRIAEEVGYVFVSETSHSTTVDADDSVASMPSLCESVDSGYSPTERSNIKRGWYYWKGYILAFVNARGSCSMRRFHSNDGTFVDREYKSGDYQQNFAEYVTASIPLSLSRQVNLERDCNPRLPAHVLAELKQQVASSQPGVIDAENGRP